MYDGSMTNQPYNPDNYRQEFRQYLIAVKKSANTIRNYLSDLRYFFGWLNVNFGALALNQIKNETIRAYRGALIEDGIPTKTINRRLSTLRLFFKFCVGQDWIKENPVKKIANFSGKKNSLAELSSQFFLSLKKKGVDEKKISVYQQDIQEFSKIISSHI